MDVKQICLRRYLRQGLACRPNRRVCSELKNFRVWPWHLCSNICHGRVDLLRRSVLVNIDLWRRFKCATSGESAEKPIHRFIQDVWGQLGKMKVVDGFAFICWFPGLATRCTNSHVFWEVFKWWRRKLGSCVENHLACNLICCKVWLQFADDGYVNSVAKSFYFPHVQKVINSYKVFNVVKLKQVNGNLLP